MISLYQFPRVWGLPNPSPFCIKVEAFLSYNSIEYQVEELMQPSKAPRGRLPFIKDSDGELVSDSNIIIKHLVDKYKIKINQTLTQEQLALGHMATRMLEEGSRWILVDKRWRDEDSWPQMKEYISSNMPALMSSFVPNIVRKKVIKDLESNGVSDYTDEEKLAIFRKDLGAISALLEDKLFLLGSSISTFDFSVYAFMLCLAPKGADSGLREALMERPNLVSYLESMHGLCFPRGYDLEL